MEFKKLVKWLPVAVAGVVACFQAVSEIKEADRINDMEDRIAKLETKEES